MDSKILYDKIYNSEIYKTLEDYKSKNGPNVFWDGHNGTLCNPHRDIEFQYVEWLVETLLEIKSNNINILETGTNYGSFSHICYSVFDNFNLYTNDIVQDSEIVISKINKFYGKNMTKFKRGQLEHLNYSNINFDVAWLDSGHSFDILYTELLECKKYKIKNILVDDSYESGEVTKAVGKFLYQYPIYRIRKCTTYINSGLCGLWLELNDYETFV